MPKRIEVKPYLRVEELRTCYLDAEDSIERTRWQAIWLIAQGRSSDEVAEVTGRKAQWVQRTVRRFNAEPQTGVADRRHENRGKRPLLCLNDRQALEVALEGAAPDGGSWSGPKVALWMGELLGRSIRPQRGWDALRRVGFTVQRPRPHHQQADDAAQASFQGHTPRGVQCGSGGGRAGSEARRTVGDG